jgi:dTDP-4-amino-4,6-dideoxygalactose transaminase
VNAREHFRRYRREFEVALLGTLENGDLIMRQQLRDFEQHLAEFVGVRYAVGPTTTTSIWTMSGGKSHRTRKRWFPSTSTAASARWTQSWTSRTRTVLR